MGHQQRPILLWVGLWLAFAATSARPAHADDRRSSAFSALWGNLLRNSSASTAAASWREGAADLHTKLLERLSGSGAAGNRTLDGWLAKPLNLTLEALQSITAGSGDAGGDAPPDGATLSQRLRAHLESAAGEWGQVDVREVAALAALQGWALTALLKGSHGGLPAPVRHATGSRPLGAVLPKAAWPGFRGQLCLRLQDLGSGGGEEGRRSAAFGADPCSEASGADVASGIRWGTGASFSLDCTLGAAAEAALSGSSSGGNGSATAPPPPPQLHGKPLHCGLAVASDAGGGAVLSHSMKRPLLLARSLNAARIRICNLGTSPQQYPAALHSGGSITLLGLKLNGRPLLPAPASLSATPAASADGCLQTLVRVSHKATDAGFVLSGWVGLDAGQAAGQAAAPGRFGAGERASVEVALGEWKAPSLLDSAAARLAGGTGQQALDQP